MCPNAKKSAIRAYKLHENARKKLVGEGEEPSPSIFFSSLLEFDPTSDKAVTRLLDFLKSGLIEVKRYEKAFLHGKAYLFGTDLSGAPEGVLAGSSNFTAAGLTRNLELNLGRYDPTPAGKVKDWFDRLWNEAVPYDLATLTLLVTPSTRLT